MKIDLDGAGLGAGAAKRGSIREMLPVLQPAQMRRDHRADRTLISRSVGVAADVAVDGADIQARAAADTMKGIALLGVREQVRSLVVQQHQMEFLRPVGFARLARAAIERVVARQRLSGARGGKHRQEERQIFKLRKDFLDAHQRDVHLGQRAGQPGVSFVFGDGNHSGFGDREIRAS